MSTIARWVSVAAIALVGCKGSPEATSGKESHAPAADSAPRTGDSGPTGAPGGPAGGAAVPPATPDVVALLDGLKPGDSIGPATVARVSAVVGGAILVYVTQGPQRGMVSVVKRGGPNAPNPPATSEKYAVYFRTEKGAPDVLPEKVIMDACTALAERLRRTEPRAPTPAGLSAYVSDPPSP